MRDEVVRFGVGEVLWDGLGDERLEGIVERSVWRRREPERGTGHLDQD